MPKSAIPKHVLERNWKGTDNDSWLMRLKKKIQYVFAAGPNVPSGFFKFREIPKLIFTIKGNGLLRFENTNGSKILPFGLTLRWFRNYISPGYYLSRIQPWTRWHVSVQWPLFLNCHFIYMQKDVVEYPTYQSAFGIKKMFTFGVGFKRDGDKVYWLTMNGFGNFE